MQILEAYDREGGVDAGAGKHVQEFYALRGSQ